jgi:glycosyltransferase involved in cell wall biosynthesis
MKTRERQAKSYILDEQMTTGRVAMLAHSYYLVDPRVRREAEAIASAGYKVDVFALAEKDEPAKSEANGVTIIRLPVRRHRGHGLIVYLLEYLTFLCLCAVKLLAVWPRRRYELIQVHNPPDFLVFAALVPHIFGSKVILDIHDFMAEGFLLKGRQSQLFQLLRTIEKSSWLFADHIITVHEEYKKIIVKRGIAAEKITVVMNVPDDRLFHGQALARDIKSATKDRFTLVYHGTLADRYGLDVAIRAIKVLVTKIPELRFEIYGEGDSRSRLQALVLELNLQGFVWFSGRMCNMEAILADLCQANLAVVPTLETPFTDLMLPTKLMEYAALGIPSAVARTKTVAAYFTDSMVRYFQPGNSDDLADQIWYLYRHPDELDKLRAEAGHFTTTYNWRTNRQTYIDLIGRMIGEKSGDLFSKSVENACQNHTQNTRQDRKAESIR